MRWATPKPNRQVSVLSPTAVSPELKGTEDPFDRVVTAYVAAAGEAHRGRAPSFKKDATIELFEGCFYRVAKQIGRSNGTVYLLSGGFACKVYKSKETEDLASAYHEYAVAEELRDRAHARGASLDRWLLPLELHLWLETAWQTALILMPTHSPCRSLLWLHDQGPLVAAFALHEVLVTLHVLHKCGFLHADVKPDNFLLVRGQGHLGVPFRVVGLDLGRAVDLECTSRAFLSTCHVAPFRCPEMKKAALRPWTYQIDAYGAACIAYGCLKGKSFALKTVEEDGRHRAVGVDKVWTRRLDPLLNGPPSVATAGSKYNAQRTHDLCVELETALAGHHDELAGVLEDLMP